MDLSLHAPHRFDGPADRAADLMAEAEEEVRRCQDLLTAQLDLIAARRGSSLACEGALLGLRELSLRLEAAETVLGECRALPLRRA